MENTKTETLNEEIDRIFKSRKSRETHPDGTFDNAGRWYPSVKEKCDCCSNIRTPSRRYPYSYMTHCRTRKHIRKLVMAQRGLESGTE